MPRPSKPVKLLVFEKKTHLTKAEIAARISAEIKIGDSNYRFPDYIAENEVAYAKWQEVIGYIKKNDTLAELVTSTDSDCIAGYCQTCAEERALLTMWGKAKTGGTKKKYNSLLLKIREMKLKLQREIFFSPASKIRNVPKRAKEKEQSPLEKAGFGNV